MRITLNTSKFNNKSKVKLTKPSSFTDWLSHTKLFRIEYQQIDLYKSKTSLNGKNDSDNVLYSKKNFFNTTMTDFEDHYPIMLPSSDNHYFLELVVAEEDS